MKRAAVLIGITTLLIGLGVAASHGGLTVTPDHALYDTKTEVEQEVESLAANESEQAEAKLEHAEKRVNESQQMAEANETDLANQTANAYAQKMQEVNDLGEQVSDLAQQRKIDTLVAKATQHHTTVLAAVYERVPDEAKAGISKALNRSVQDYKRATNALNRTGGIPDGVATNISSRIPSSVRQQSGIGKPGAMAKGGGQGSDARSGSQDMGNESAQDGSGQEPAP